MNVQAHPNAINGVSDQEWQTRLELAACYHVFDMLGWTELIFNHITVKVPGGGEHFLINPYGLTYDEVTPENLVKIDLDGKIVGKSDWPVNPAGFLIHAAIHANRPDAKCVMHTHTTAGSAVAGVRGGLSNSNFYAAQLYGEVGYHEFEGITTEADEAPRLLASLGNRDTLILANHGLLACGPSIAEAFYRLWRIERACQIQLATAAMGQPIEIPDEVCAKATAQLKTFDPGGSGARRIFAAMRRKVARQRPGLPWLAANG